MVHQNSAQRNHPPVNAQYISVRNAEALTGQGYRWCRDMAHTLGVNVLNIGRKRLIPAAEFFAALERANEKHAQTEPVDPTAAVLASLGLVVRK